MVAAALCNLLLRHVVPIATAPAMFLGFRHRMQSFTANLRCTMRTERTVGPNVAGDGENVFAIDDLRLDASESTIIVHHALIIICWE